MVTCAHKSGHAALVAEAFKKAETKKARATSSTDHQHHTDADDDNLRRLNKRELELLKELRKGLSTAREEGCALPRKSHVPNRLSLLKRERIEVGREENDSGEKRENENENEKGVEANREGKEKQYLSKAERKRLKKRRTKTG